MLVQLKVVFVARHTSANVDKEMRILTFMAQIFEHDSMLSVWITSTEEPQMQLCLTSFPPPCTCSQGQIRG